MTGTDSRQTRALAHSRIDRARSLDSLHAAEKAAGSAGPPRPDEWRHDLLAALDELSASLHEQHRTSAGDDSLLGQVTLEAPHLEPAVRSLREGHQAIEERLVQLRGVLADHSRSLDIDAVRNEMSAISTRLRDLRSWETDIVYEAYSVDIGAGD